MKSLIISKYSAFKINICYYLTWMSILRNEVFVMKNKIIKYIISFITIILISGCGSKFAYIIDETPVRPNIIEDKALIYVIRPSYIGFMVPFKVYLDDKPAGLTKGKTYFYFYTTPGYHVLKTIAGNTTNLELNLVAGEKYYVKQSIILDKIKPGTDVKIINEDEGEKYLKKINLLKFLKIPRLF